MPLRKLSPEEIKQAFHFKRKFSVLIETFKSIHNREPDLSELTEIESAAIAFVQGQGLDTVFVKSVKMSL